MPEPVVRSEAPETSSTQSIRFLESMPRPLIVLFLLLAAAGLGLVVWTFAHPPVSKQVALASRRSPPVGRFSHDSLLVRMVAVPNPLPAYTPPHACPEFAGVIIEGSVRALDRIGRVLDGLCGAKTLSSSPEFQQALKALGTARIRFALFKRTGNLSTAYMRAGRILLAVGLSHETVAVGTIAPLLIHEAYHLSQGLPVTATQEFHARVAEFAACAALFDEDQYTRGCDDARDIVSLGKARAIDLFIRAGYPR